MADMPLIAFYAIPSGRFEDKNNLVYQARFKFDVHTNDDVSLAHDIAQRITGLFQGEMIQLEEVTSFETELVNQYETPTNLASTYAFTTVLNFSIALDK